MKHLALVLVLLLTGCGGAAVKQQSNERAQSSAKIHTELAGMYFERTQMGIALSEIDLALRADQNYAPAYNVRGLIHMSLREDAEAEADFVQSLRLDKTDSEAHNNYGWFLCQRGRESESITHFMAAVKNPLYTTPERAYLNAGLCFQKAGKTQDAEEFLQRALRLQPELTQALLAMAELKFSAGEYSAASKYFAGLKKENLTAAQLLLAVRIERRTGNVNAEASYAMHLRQRYPDSRETQLLMQGE
ncbi:MAG TPA: type IV pilus biogenesis/stability protein PilW [Gallionella sp.]|jgi:type IV pilus assembly protein PilF|nr:type IV pilus biogenesis/stability protein PilW [Gallionella sp.]OGS67675.1 MAG: type IV pilus biogenesis/stability protein PilW [Gallionellales bacterium GWA2_54_124]OGT18714.1 MAG: type IV pilus biogenesis/stability protein PilW [Gallionellales bacterium RIFOXYD12_FULL_53_10]HCI52526.1 type IV pilus biogenesis/stability protein PilW [Gallionella sp.]